MKGAMLCFGFTEFIDLWDCLTPRCWIDQDVKMLGISSIAPSSKPERLYSWELRWIDGWLLNGLTSQTIKFLQRQQQWHSNWWQWQSCCWRQKQQVNKHKLHRGSMLKSRWPMRNAWRTQEVNELVGLRPGWWQNKINTNNYQVRRVEEGSKLIACLNCEVNGLETNWTKCENKAELKAICEAQILSESLYKSVESQQESSFEPLTSHSRVAMVSTGVDAAWMDWVEELQWWNKQWGQFDWHHGWVNLWLRKPE